MLSISYRILIREFDIHSGRITLYIVMRNVVDKQWLEASGYRPYASPSSPVPHGDLFDMSPEEEFISMILAGSIFVALAVAVRVRQVVARMHSDPPYGDVLQRTLSLAGLPVDSRGSLLAQIFSFDRASFRVVMRVFPEEFEELCRCVARHIVPTVTPARQYGVQTHVAVYLAYASYGLPYRALGAYFGIGKHAVGTGHIKRMIFLMEDAIHREFDRFLAIPSRRDLERMQQHNFERYGIACAAAIDGCHILIQPREDNERSACRDYKKNFSMTMLAHDRRRTRVPVMRRARVAEGGRFLQSRKQALFCSICGLRRPLETCSI